MKAVVLAGGKGTRLAPYTKVLPKPLMPIGDMPILEILIRQMKMAGVDEIILTVGHMAELLRAFFQGGHKFDVPITYSTEDKPLGTAGPLSLIGKESLMDTFLVMNGDVLTTLKLQDLVEFHKSSGSIATIAMHHRKVPIDLGVLEFGDDNKLTNYIEKPVYEFHVSMGMYVFEPEVLDYIPYNQYLDFPDLVHKLMDAGETIIGYPFTGYWQDLGRPDDYERAVADFDDVKDKMLLGEI